MFHLFQWTPVENRRRGRPRKSGYEEIIEARGATTGKYTEFVEVASRNGLAARTEIALIIRKMALRGNLH
jgi:hypothetical protein